MTRRAITTILSLLALWATVANAAETAVPSIAAPQAICVIPRAEATIPEFSCRVPFTTEGTACECRMPDGKRASGQVKIVLPPPNKPLN